MTREILTIKVPVPVPEIKTYSRWRVFLALFDRKAHFTTCDTLRYQLAQETELMTRKLIDNCMARKPRADTSDLLSEEHDPASESLADPVR
jgi:hypothetical protein